MKDKPIFKVPRNNYKKIKEVYQLDDDFIKRYELKTPKTIDKEFHHFHYDKLYKLQRELNLSYYDLRINFKSAATRPLVAFENNIDCEIKKLVSNIQEGLLIRRCLIELQIDNKSRPNQQEWKKLDFSKKKKTIQTLSELTNNKKRIDILTIKSNLRNLGYLVCEIPLTNNKESIIHGVSLWFDEIPLILINTDVCKNNFLKITTLLNEVKNLNDEYFKNEEKIHILTIVEIENNEIRNWVESKTDDVLDFKNRRYSKIESLENKYGSLYLDLVNELYFSSIYNNRMASKFLDVGMFYVEAVLLEWDGLEFKRSKKKN